MADLHITNGDGAANIIKASSVGGDVLPWRDPMHHGPFPAGLDLDELSKIRGRYFAGPAPEQDDDGSADHGNDAGRDFRLRDDHLRSAAKYERVILWFEHDLLDQLQILQLLDWFSSADLPDLKLEMICIDQFEGIDPFRGIGQLNATQMASLIDLRKGVTENQLELATRGWAAFRSDDPCDLVGFLDGDLTPLAFLHAALSRHLEEYPSSYSGLTRTEHQILKLVAAGVSDPGTIFLENMALETVYFIGDWPTYRHINDLCAGADPLLTTANGEPFWSPPDVRQGADAFREQRLQLTKSGRDVLAGKRSAFELIERDFWLGGVHLQSGKPMWTWNTEQRELQFMKPAS